MRISHMKLNKNKNKTITRTTTTTTTPYDPNSSDSTRLPRLRITEYCKHELQQIKQTNEKTQQMNVQSGKQTSKQKTKKQRKLPSKQTQQTNKHRTMTCIQNKDKNPFRRIYWKREIQYAHRVKATNKSVLYIWHGVCLGKLSACGPRPVLALQAWDRGPPAVPRRSTVVWRQVAHVTVTGNDGNETAESHLHTVVTVHILLQVSSDQSFPGESPAHSGHRSQVNSDPSFITVTYTQRSPFTLYFYW